MEKPPPEKSGSFSRNGNGNQMDDNPGPAGPESEAVHVRLDCQQPGECEPNSNLEEPSSDPELSLPQVLKDVDRFLESLSTRNDASNNPLDVPNSVESLLEMIQKMITKYDSNAKFGQKQEEDSSFIESLNCISKLINALGEFPSNSTTASCFNRASTILHLAMSLLDSEFRLILETCNQGNNADLKSPKPLKQSSFSSRQESTYCVIPESKSSEDVEFPAYTSEAISKMNRIATAMISSGYESECCMVYNMVRRNAFSSELDKLGFENISIDDVQRMQWQSLEGVIAMWITVIKQSSSVLFSGERKLCSSIFSEHPSISQRLFCHVALAVAVRFVNFSDAIALTKRSAEKLFKILDMYEALRDLIPFFDDDTCASECYEELKSEIWAAKGRLGEVAVSIFCDLENSIRRDNGRTPVPSGAVHPLTRYTMNYLKYACEYKDTLEQVFQKHQKMEGFANSNGTVLDIKNGANDDGTPKTSPFSVQLNSIMDLLDENLDMKSKLYRDPALRCIFLMNNGRYILQKIKGSDEIHDMMGDTWCRKRSSDLRQYHKAYTRETWTRLLQCLNHDGLMVNGKLSKTILKERFKMFSTMFDEIHRTQSTWVVSDDQLQSELRISVSAVVTPAYRSFVGRFQQYLASGRQPDKYIKYQPEDIENLIDELFDGNPTSMARRRT
ncbi:exocyst complex component EXO70C1 [Populus nigra]|uniref:exocyst complex component EXO70C1 n=1 Tax=Populus nigra TaxID=3691 RepID=UPI002B26EF91|nr:exocyst complex component EXO70C1 [Populus nigra]